MFCLIHVMRGYKDRDAGFHQIIQYSPENPPGGRIYSCSWLIQNDDLRLMQERDAQELDAAASLLRALWSLYFPVRLGQPIPGFLLS